MLKTLITCFKSLINEELGQAMVEYAFIIAFIALIVMVLIGEIGQIVVDLFYNKVIEAFGS